MFTACDGYDSCEDKPMIEYVVNARMPYLSEVSNYSASANNAYLYDNLDLDCYDDECTEYNGVHEEGMTHVLGAYGYWTLSSNASLLTYEWDLAWFVSANGVVNYDARYVVGGCFGVRPVINLSI